MKKAGFAIACLLFLTAASAQLNKVTVISSREGVKLVTGSGDFMINGMNWDYIPVGKNYSFSLWQQPDEFIKVAIDQEMPLLSAVGVNTIRVYAGIQPRWITYIYERYGIYTMLNHSFGRYGMSLDGKWDANTDYSDPRVKEMLLKEVSVMAGDYKNTPGLLMYLLGNENNYGLFWAGAETENIPAEQVQNDRARALFRLFNEAALAVKAIDTNVPVAICNGDLLFLDIIAEECRDIDILGCNMYRGVSFGDAFQKVKKAFDKPLLLTEFGADAFNAVSKTEDQEAQAYYLINNWKEIYENAAGLGNANNCIGGFTFQFSDGWWKYKQDENLDIHDNNASWSNGGYSKDYVEGENNMNEEWFGICAKGRTDARGHYSLYPRKAYYALQNAHRLNPYAAGMTSDSVNRYFLNIR
jgi:hypothetical protein